MGVPPLDEGSLPEDGLVALRQWVDAAAGHTAVEDARIACLATADAEGVPDARMVVVREVADDGLVFHTSHVSAKAQQLAVRPIAALVYWWEPLMRQARVRGRVTRLSGEEADARFAALPHGSKIAAWASDQQAELPDRAVLEAAFEAAAARFPGAVPRPEHWGCYRVHADVVELWQGHPEDRMHDRVRYVRRDGSWTRTRIAP